MFFRLLSDAPVRRPSANPKDVAGPGVWGPMAGLQAPRAVPAGEVLPLRPLIHRPKR